MKNWIMAPPVSNVPYGPTGNIDWNPISADKPSPTTVTPYPLTMRGSVET